MTTSNRALLVAGGALATLCAVGAIIWVGISLRGLRSELSLLRKDTASIGSLLANDDNRSQETTQPEPEMEFRTVAEADARIHALGSDQLAERLAQTINELDGWLVMPDEEERFQAFKVAQVERLRRVVSAEVTAHLEAALGGHGEQC